MLRWGNHSSAGRVSKPTQDFEMTTRNNGDRNKNGARNNDERRERLAAGIRRQFGTEATMRFLRALPAFRTENDIPDRFKELLDRLDGIESSVAAGGRRR
jgi:hypothetical protein